AATGHRAIYLGHRETRATRERSHGAREDWHLVKQQLSTPFVLAANVASPPQVETQCPPLSITMMLPAPAASITSPTLNSSEVKSPRAPVTWRTVTARPAQRVPGTTCVKPRITPVKAISSSALCRKTARAASRQDRAYLDRRKVRFLGFYPERLDRIG